MRDGHGPTRRAEPALNPAPAAHAARSARIALQDRREGSNQRAMFRTRSSEMRNVARSSSHSHELYGSPTLPISRARSRKTNVPQLERRRFRWNMFGGASVFVLRATHADGSSGMAARSNRRSNGRVAAPGTGRILSLEYVNCGTSMCVGRVYSVSYVQRARDSECLDKRGAGLRKVSGSA